MSEITVTPGPGLSVVVQLPGGPMPLALGTPDQVYARIDLICERAGEIGVIPGRPAPPPLTAPGCPEGAEVLAGVLVRPVYVASSDIIEPAKLQQD